MNHRTHGFGSVCRIALAAFASIGLGLGSAAHAQAFPTKQITMVVPFTAGGPTDKVARDLAEVMRKSLGQPVIVENVGGAGGTIGTQKVARAAPDGYTVLLMHIGFATAPTLYRKLGYDPAKAFESIGGAVDVPMTVIARADFPAKDTKELLTYIKANASKLNLAHAGIGSASHLCGLLLTSQLQASMQTIPFKGTADAMNAILGGQVDLLCDQTTNTTGQIQSGKVKAYAVTTAMRLPTLPKLPTLDESGLGGFNLAVWHGLWAPAGTPKPVIDKLKEALDTARKDPAFVKRMADSGAIVIPTDRAQAERWSPFVLAETARWSKVISTAGVYAD